MAKNDNPFGIRKSPVELITAQTLTLDDYVKRSDEPFKSCMSNRRG
jgi:hypothetical protein